MAYTPSRDPLHPRSVVSDSLDATGGVLSRRIIAYLLDFIFIGIFTAVLSVAAFFLLIISFGLLHVWPIIPFTAFLYATLTIGGRHGATWGMRMLNVHYRRLDGGPPEYFQALVATILFYVTIGVTGGFILLVPLFTTGHRTLHDILSGLMLVRNDAGMRF